MPRLHQGEDRLAALRRQVQVNAPFTALVERYLPLFLDQGLNPEIGLDCRALEGYSRAEFQAVADRLHSRGLHCTLHAPFHDLIPGALDPLIRAASRQRLRQAFDLIEVFRPRSIVCHPGYESRMFVGHEEDWLAHSAATWAELAPLAAAHGARMMLENVYEPDPHPLAALLERLEDSRVGFCLDVGHLQAFGNGDFTQWLTVLGPRVGQLHLHDNDGGDDQHLALGHGTVPLAFVLKFLASRGAAPLVTLEPHQENSLQPSLEHLADLWPW